MPKAKTGCDTVLYTKISREANTILNQLVADAQKASGWKVSRALVVDRLIHAMEAKAFRIDRPEYKPHRQAKRITSATRSTHAK
jgi:hypothetical protein